MTENTISSPNPGAFHWSRLPDSTPSGERVPLIADTYIAELFSISRSRTTRKARVAMARAQVAVLDFGNTSLGTEHLLLGVLRTPSDEISAMLEQHGLERIHLLNMLEATLPHGAEPVPEAISLTSSCKEAINFAQEETSRLQQQQVGTEHLLLGMSREGSGVAGTFLERCGLSYARLQHTFSSQTDTRDNE